MVIKVGTILFQCSMDIQNGHASLPTVSILMLMNLMVGKAISRCRIIRTSPYNDRIKISIPSDL